MSLEIIGNGAEAIIEREGNLVHKRRLVKAYRLPVIDSQLRSQRTKREAKVLQKLSAANIPCPKLVSTDEKELITMSFLDGPKLRDIFAQKPFEHSKEIGKLIAELHKVGVVHSDLTTSNMIFSENKIHLIDFGLSFFSVKPEDRACDLHLLARALESKHHEQFVVAWEQVVRAYKQTFPEHEAIFARLEKVEMRGRNKQKN
ncbi:MAG: KEOPS complex kinase/ATPase Bud32 [Candidatus Woesearchaeota archaeon]|nr:KEOPS complex kinase/ATPase Bud32 [Candidatus Woesearchaeota archaeon]